MRKVVVPMVCGLVGIVLWNGVVYLLAQRARAAPLSTLDANQVVSQWAEAARLRDYETTDSYMRDVDPLTVATWREENERNVSHGWIASYVRADLAPMPKRNAYTAQVRWTGSGPRPVCMTVQITQERQIKPLSMPRFCKPEAQL